MKDPKNIPMNEYYWTRRAPAPPSYESVKHMFNGTEKDWYSLSPGMRTQIVREEERRIKKLI